MKRVILVVLIAAFAGGIRAHAMSAAVIKEQIALVQGLLDVFRVNRALFDRMSRLGVGVFSDAMSVVKKVELRVEQQISGASLVHLNSDQLIVYKNAEVEAAIKNLYAEEEIGLKEIERQLENLTYEPGIEGLEESLRKFGLEKLLVHDPLESFYRNLKYKD